MATRMVVASQHELEELNRTFHNGDLFEKGFYDALGMRGCDCKGSYLVKVVPEGVLCVTGTIICQDGRVAQFDIDISSGEVLSWNDVTREFMAEYASLRRSKPWARTVVSYDLFVRANRIASK